MVTEAGTLAEALELVRDTVVPPKAAGPFSVAVPVAEVPPCTEVGVMDTVEI